MHSAGISEFLQFYQLFIGKITRRRQKAKMEIGRYFKPAEKTPLLSSFNGFSYCRRIIKFLNDSTRSVKRLACFELANFYLKFPLKAKFLRFFAHRLRIICLLVKL